MKKIYDLQKEFNIIYKADYIPAEKVWEWILENFHIKTVTNTKERKAFLLPPGDNPYGGVDRYAGDRDKYLGKE